MRIAFLGGTGDIGEGLALRWGRDADHELVIGSRDPDKARTAAVEYETELADRGRERTIEGLGNAAAAAHADVVVLSVPAYYVADTIDAVGDGLDDAILVSPAVGMIRDDDGMHYDPPPAGSVTEHAAAAAPPDMPVVGTFHNLPARRLANLDATLDLDTPIVGDDPDATATVADLVNAIDGLHALDAGGLANAAEAEALAPLLINVGRHAGLDDVGVSFH